MTDFIIQLDQITDAVIAAIPRATRKGAEHLHQVAVSKTPLRDGNLRTESSVMEIPHGAAVYYPGPYARYQHYELQLHHTEGQALYLEQPLVQETETILEIMAQEFRDAIE